jgi:FAD/FMN-containing dehydrogenase
MFSILLDERVCVTITLDVILDLMSTNINTNIDYLAIALELKGIETTSDREKLTKLSLDYYHFSPILQEQLQAKRGDLAVFPTTEAEVLRVAQVCVQNKIPLTVRGAGTGNYGQCIPLQGGIILDTSKMNQIISLQPGIATVQPGVRMADFDQQGRKIGWELRMAPSTYRTASICLLYTSDAADEEL